MMRILRPCALGLVVLLAGAVDAAEVAPAPGAALRAGAAGPARVHARKGKKRRRVRRKPIKPTKFQNLTPHEHLGPSISR